MSSLNRAIDVLPEVVIAVNKALCPLLMQREVYIGDILDNVTLA